MPSAKVSAFPYGAERVKPIWMELKSLSDRYSSGTLFKSSTEVRCLKARKNENFKVPFIIKVAFTVFVDHDQTAQNVQSDL